MNPTPIKDLALCDRPREKLMARGSETLSDFELLQVVIGSGNKHVSVGGIAVALKKLIHKVGISNLTPERLKQVPGLSTAKITLILAAVEFIRRQTLYSGHKVDTPTDILPFVQNIVGKKQEYLLTVTLDGADCIQSVRTVAIGTLTELLTHPREVFADAITERAASIILVHNHPAGTVEPSPADIRLTRKLCEVGRLLGIPVRDHVIVAGRGFFSFAENGVLGV